MTYRSPDDRTPYRADQLTIAYDPAEGVAARAMIAMLTQLNPGAVVDDIFTDQKAAPAGLRSLIITYHEPTNA